MPSRIIPTGPFGPGGKRLATADFSGSKKSVVQAGSLAREGITESIGGQHEVKWLGLTQAG